MPLPKIAQTVELVRGPGTRQGAERRFRVFKGQYIDCWCWECSLCNPPARGMRHGADAYTKIMEVSMPHHMNVRQYHHRWVAQNGQ